MAVSAEDFVDQLQKDCLEHPAMRHLKRFENREVNKDQVKLFAEQYYCFSRHFSRYLAALVAITPDEASRAPLIKNLHEEYGGRQEENQELLRLGAMDFLDARTVLWDGLERASGF